jgi:dimethylargininase
VFRNAIVRPPAENFAEGLTTVDLGVPDVTKALDQHAACSEALERCGLALTRLDPDPRFPDSTFIEDSGVLTPRGAILTRPGAPSREGEVAAIATALSAFFREPARIEAPGTVDGGDVCEAGDHFFIGVSRRTNPEGARQLARHLAALGYSSEEIDIRGMSEILHLKSGIAAVDERRLVVMEALADHPAFRDYERLVVAPHETYAANCVRVNDAILIAAGFPQFEAAARRLPLDVIVLEVSEFQKMDGGLSCLSLRF